MMTATPRTAQRRKILFIRLTPIREAGGMLAFHYPPIRNLRNSKACSAIAPCIRLLFGREIVLERHAVLHHEDHILDRVDVLRRITVNRDDVGELARFDRADSIRPIQ